MKKSLFFAAAVLTLAACTREMDVKTPVGKMTITARTETSAETKTIVEGQTHVYWEPGDEIKVFAGGKSGKFTTDITASSPSATFNGTLGDDAWTEGMDLWAVYPYSKDAVFDGETITTVLPSEQVARAGSFGKEMNLAIANSTTSDLQFYNVGGGIRFSLSQDGITKVVLQGLNGEALAGKVRIGFQNGIPVIQEVTEEKTSISITTPDGGAFKNNCWYYIVAIPGALENGFIMSFRKDGVMGSREFDRAVTIKRGIFGTLSRADKEPGTSYTVPDAVDLGLPSGLKWASFNLGASKPEEYGAYYAWGETEPKDDYSWETYKWCMGSNTTMTKYCTTSPHGSFGNNGFTDNKTILDPEDDAAHVNLGGKWRMATYEECVELRENCTWTWTTQNGVNGSLITGPNGNSIFLPAAGNWFGTDLNEEGSLGGTWGSSLDTFYPYTAWGQAYNEEWVIAGDMGGDRYVGCTIRPVYDDGTVVQPPTPVPEAVDLGLPSGLKWASFNLGASKPEEFGDYYAWGETEPYYSSLDPLTWRPGKEAGYTSSSYKWCMGSYDTLTKYCFASMYGYNGYSDSKRVLDSEDDAAYVNLGGKWRMPTPNELNELIVYCTWKWTQINGVNGLKVTGLNGNSIFLPAAGTWEDGLYLSHSNIILRYWSSFLWKGDTCMGWSMTGGDGIIVGENGEENHATTETADGRPAGLSIRPVYGEIIPVESISLNKTELEIKIDEEITLKMTILPSNASFYGAIWSSSNESIVTVSPSGVITGVSVGAAVITATTLDGKLTATCNVTVKESSPSASVPEAVDLGLSVKWASFNLGASKPEEYGDYYAWGETQPKSEYTESTYKWLNEEWEVIKYCPKNDRISWGGAGDPDGKTVLDPEDDAAHVNLGGLWRMPTRQEWKQLWNNCAWTWTTLNGVNGMLLTASNGNSIFLPAAGSAHGFEPNEFGGYWSCSLTNSDEAYNTLFYFYDSYSTPVPDEDFDCVTSRWAGYPVRPVFAQ